VVIPCCGQEAPNVGRRAGPLLISTIVADGLIEAVLDSPKPKRPRIPVLPGMLGSGRFIRRAIARNGGDAVEG